VTDDLANRAAAAIAKQRAEAARATAEDGHLADSVPLAQARVAAHFTTPSPDPPPPQAGETLAALIAAGVPADYAEVVAGSNVEDTPAIASLRLSLETGARFVILSGGVGVGKSIAAALWLRRMRDKHGACGMLWRHAHEVARVSGYGHEEEQKQLEQCNFLVLDDLGVEFSDAKGFFAATIDSLIYQRHGNRRPTVCTTNLAASDFKERYGARVVDRIKQVGAFVQIAGDSRREALTRAAQP
jgi:DNA replication protein DnaC